LYFTIITELSGEGFMVDSRVYSYAIGMEQARHVVLKLKKS